MTTVSLTDTFRQLGCPKVLVLGDLMLDRYTSGRAGRTSQEAPVLVLEVENRDHRPGGASNVCQMLATLDCEVTCVGVVGEDDAGQRLVRLLSASGVGASSIVTDDQRPTTLKERFIGRSGSGLPSQILRVDTETRTPIRSATETRIIHVLQHEIPQHDAVLISDYDKGVCTPRCVQAAIECARKAGVPILVDPGRGRDFEIYRGATLIKPNRPETEAATGQPIVQPQDALQAGRQLCQDFEIEMAVITLDADGIALARRDHTGELFPTRARSVYDITGAGDMVLAVLGLAVADQIDASEAVQLANVAAGLEVDRAGVAVFTRHEIQSSLLTHQTQSTRKVTDIGTVARLAEDYRLRGKQVVLTNGCFDLLHIGHVTYLEEAASLGDILIVAINSDASVRRLKGPERPVIAQNERAAMLAALGCIDHVVVFDNDTPHVLLDAIRPDVLVKGGTYTKDEVVGREIVEAYGGKICLAGIVDGVSTTKIVDQVRRQDGPRSNSDTSRKPPQAA